MSVFAEEGEEETAERASLVAMTKDITMSKDLTRSRDASSSALLDSESDDDDNEEDEAAGEATQKASADESRHETTSPGNDVPSGLSHDKVVPPTKNDKNDDDDDLEYPDTGLTVSFSAVKTQISIPRSDSVQDSPVGSTAPVHGIPISSPPSEKYQKFFF